LRASGAAHTLDLHGTRKLYATFVWAGNETLAAHDSAFSARPAVALPAYSISGRSVERLGLGPPIRRGGVGEPVMSFRHA
jgi:hypothetical protein